MTQIGRDTTITWLGHGTFLLTTSAGKRLLLDAWVDTNPACPDDWKQRVRAEGLDAILVTHGHGDHISDLISLSKDTGAQVLCIFDIAGWLSKRGLSEDRITGFNKGGTVAIAGARVTMTQAVHSSTFEDGDTIISMGSECGYVLALENGFTVYFTGDTAVHADMQIIGDLYKPDLVILPIGDHFTMGPRQAAYALKLIGAQYAIPGHYATFPLLTGTPEALREHLATFGASTGVIVLKPGESAS